MSLDRINDEINAVKPGEWVRPLDPESPYRFLVLFTYTTGNMLVVYQSERVGGPTRLGWSVIANDKLRPCPPPYPMPELFQEFGKSIANGTK
jgi:hypothetical protein